MLCSPETVGVVECSVFSTGTVTSYLMIWCGTISSRFCSHCAHSWALRAPVVT